MINPEDFKYIGLKRQKGDDPNIPIYKGDINGITFEFKLLGRGKVEMKKGEGKTEFTGFTKASLLDVTGFKEVHENISEKKSPPTKRKPRKKTTKDS